MMYIQNFISAILLLFVFVSTVNGQEASTNMTAVSHLSSRANLGVGVAIGDEIGISFMGFPFPDQMLSGTFASTEGQYSSASASYSYVFSNAFKQTPFLAPSAGVGLGTSVVVKKQENDEKDVRNNRTYVFLPLGVQAVIPNTRLHLGAHWAPSFYVGGENVQEPMTNKMVASIHYMF